ncbi:unnamed protein product [Cladocopium goreaui]|uniref:Polycystin-2 n=1 Tax=Cladocopium goreaui TaxID=2562237 RepID=A0A9P1C0G0_9DINO|nr:unnamed protein product [Cladocopium goreaui]
MEASSESLNQRVSRCLLWEKVKEGHVHLITAEDIEELFHAFEVYDPDLIPTSELVRLCGVDGTHLSAEEIADWIKDSDKNGTGEASIEDVHRGITEGSAAFALVKRALFGEEKEHKITECSIHDLLHWMHYEYDKKSKLWSLPETLFLFAAFVISVVLHLNVWEAFKSSRVYTVALTYGDFALEWAVDRDSLWVWLDEGWLRNVLRHDMISFARDPDPDKDPLYTNPFPGRVLKEHQIVGAVRFRRWYAVGAECMASKMWKDLYPACNMHGEFKPDDWYVFYHEKREVIEQQMEERARNFWLDDHTAFLDIQTLSYNAHQAMFTLGTLRVEFRDAGYMIHREGMKESFVDSPYYNLWFALPDLLFVVLLWNVLYAEMKEAIPAAMNGLDGIKDYLKLWNVIDWITIAFGFTTVSFWMVFVLKVSGELPEVLADLPSVALDLAVFTNRSYLTAEEFDGVVDRLGFETQMSEIFRCAEEVAESHVLARRFIFAYLFMLMIKFFKAFGSNDRLDVVIQTITGSAVDVAHFAIAFALVFICFAGAGILLLGTTVEGYHTIASALYFRWAETVSMTDIEGFEPWLQVLAYFWFFSYLSLMSILMINILVGLIFEAYGRIRSAAGEPETLLEQVGEAVENLKETANFLDMWYLICELEDDDFPAHPAELVTIRSLKKAFSKDRMTKQNAEYLIESASRFAKKEAKRLELSVSDGVRMIGQTRTNVNKLLVLSEQVNAMLKKFHLKHANETSEDWLSMYGAAQQEIQQEAVTKSVEEDDPLAATVRQKHKQEVTQKKVSREELMLHRMRSRFSDMVTMTQEQSKLLDWISRTINERQESIMDKDNWGRQKAVVLTDRCEKIEISIGKLSECLKGVDPSQLRHMPDKLKELARKVHAWQVEDSRPSSRQDHMKMLQNQMDSISLDVAQISAHAKAKADIAQALQHVKQLIERHIAGDVKLVSRQISRAPDSEGSSESPVFTQSWTGFTSFGDGEQS